MFISHLTSRMNNMGQCASVSRTSSGNSYHTAETSHPRSPESAPASARSPSEGPLAGLSRRPARSAQAQQPVDFSSSHVGQATITERGQSLETTKLDLCIGVAVAGIACDSSGTVAATSASLFHVLPGRRSPGVAIAQQVQQLEAAGYTVTACIGGGDRTALAGQKERSAIEAMLGGMNVSCSSLPPSDGRTSQILKVRIDDDGGVTFGVKNAH